MRRQPNRLLAVVPAPGTRTNVVRTGKGLVLRPAVVPAPGTRTNVVRTGKGLVLPPRRARRLPLGHEIREATAGVRAARRAGTASLYGLTMRRRGRSQTSPSGTACRAPGCCGAGWRGAVGRAWR